MMADPQLQSYKKTIETHPEIKKAMKKDQKKAMWASILTKSTQPKGSMSLFELAKSWVMPSRYKR